MELYKSYPRLRKTPWKRRLTEGNALISWQAFHWCKFYRPSASRHDAGVVKFRPQANFPHPNYQLLALHVDLKFATHTVSSVQGLAILLNCRLRGKPVRSTKGKSGAAPATVNGEPLSINHWDYPGRRMTWLRPVSQETCLERKTSADGGSGRRLKACASHMFSRASIRPQSGNFFGVQET